MVRCAKRKLHCSARRYSPAPATTGRQSRQHRRQPQQRRHSQCGQRRSGFFAFRQFLRGAEFPAVHTGNFAGNLSATISNLTDPTAGPLGLDAKGIAQSSQDLAQQISDLQASLTVKQQQLTLVYAQVNVTLQQLPLLQNQLSQQLARA